MLSDMDWITTRQAAETVGISRSAAYRLMSELVETGYALLGSGGRKYTAGPSLLARTRLEPADPQRRFRLRPVILELREKTGEAVHSAALTGDRVIVLDGRRSSHAVDIGLRIGMVAPAHAMAAGKLLLAALPDSAVAGLLSPGPLPQRTRNSLPTRELLLADISGIRQRGWSQTVQESEIGVNSIAVPLDGRSWRDRMALVISTPVERGSVRALEQLARMAMETVHRHAAAGRISPWSLPRKG